MSDTSPEEQGEDLSALFGMKPKTIAPEDINEVVFKEIPDYGDHMTLQEWIRYVESGCFIDYDGHGHLAVADKCTSYTICPSDWSPRLKLPEWVTHIVWYNR